MRLRMRQWLRVVRVGDWEQVRMRRVVVHVVLLRVLHVQEGRHHIRGHLRRLHRNKGRRGLGPV